MRSDRSQANLLVALHKRERAESRAFFSRPGQERPDLRTPKGTPRRQRQFRRQQADQESLLQSRCEVQ